MLVPLAAVNIDMDTHVYELDSLRMIRTYFNRIKKMANTLIQVIKVFKCPPLSC